MYGGKKEEGKVARKVGEEGRKEGRMGVRKIGKEGGGGGGMEKKMTV